MDSAPSVAEIERFRLAVRHALGLQFEEGKSAFLAETLLQRSRSVGLPPGAYLDRIDSSSPPRSEVAALAQALTVNETSFFRNADQMRAFEQAVLSDRAATASGRIRILSAGCASGEEPYSLAIIAHMSPCLAGREIAIEAFDIDPSALHKAAGARYSSWSLRQTPAELQRRYFRADGAEFVLDAGIRKMVRFGERNLVADDRSFWQPASFDIVFCRNVIMYFAPEIARQVVARIAGSLSPGGFLFLGHAETLRGLSTEFHLRHTHGTFYYQRKDVTEPFRFADAAVRQVNDNLAYAAAVDPDTSWVDTIQRASERIHSLTGKLHSGRPQPPVRPRGPDLSPTIDLLSRERFTEARAMLNALPAENADAPEVLLLQAVLATHGGNSSAAEALCRTLLARDEMNAGAHYLLALCRESAGDIAGAGEHDQTAIYLDASFAMPWLHLGLLARRRGDQAAARQALQQALSLFEREEPARILLFGGGFGREALIALCRGELAACEGTT